MSSSPPRFKLMQQPRVSFAAMGSACAGTRANRFKTDEPAPGNPSGTLGLPLELPGLLHRLSAEPNREPDNASADVQGGEAS